MPSGNWRIRLSVYRGAECVSEGMFDTGELVVGSFTQADLCINDPALALRHLLLDISPEGEVTAKNLVEEGRVKIDDRPLAADESVTLKEGQALILGDYRILVARDDASAVDQLRGQKGAPGARDSSEGGRPALEVAMFWEETLLKVEHYPRLQEVTVGEKQGVHFFTPLTKLDKTTFPLVVPHNGKFAVNLASAGLQGQVLLKDKYYTLPELRAAGLLVGDDLLVIEGDVRCRIEIDNVAFLISHTTLPDKPKSAFFARVDFQSHIYTSISLIAHVLFMIILSLLPEEALVAQRDPRRARQPVFQVLQVAAEEKQEAVDEEREEREDGEARDETKAEEEEADPTDPKVKVREEIKTRLTPEKMAEHDRQVARQTGVSRVFEQQTDLIQDLMASGSGTWGGRSRGLRTLVSVGDGSSETTGAYFTGGGGLDPFGGTLGGPGGGGFRGTAIGATLGADGEDTGISGLGADELAKRDAGRVRFDRKVGRVSVTSGRADVEGGLDQATIGRYIRRNIGQIRWCYRTELQKDHSLEGRITVEFVIAPTGRVIQSSIAGDTMANESVAQCILRTVNLWRFPSTTGGAMARVRYPFIFRPL